MGIVSHEETGHPVIDAIRRLPIKSPRRKRAVRNLLESYDRLRTRAAVRARVDSSLISRVLHGDSVSANALRAIIAEMEEQDAKR